MFLLVVWVAFGSTKSIGSRRISFHIGKFEIQAWQ